MLREPDNGRWAGRLRAGVFLAAVALSAPYPLIRLSLSSAAPLRDALTARAEPEPRELTAFLEGVRTRTRTGDSIALLLPFTSWDDGYSYYYYRASYILAGRIVVPLVDARNERHPERLSSVAYVAAWRVDPPASFVPGPSFSSGVLARRQR